MDMGWHEWSRNFARLELFEVIDMVYNFLDHMILAKRDLKDRYGFGMDSKMAKKFLDQVKSIRSEKMNPGSTDGTNTKSMTSNFPEEDSDEDDGNYDGSDENKGISDSTEPASSTREIISSVAGFSIHSSTIQYGRQAKMSDQIWYNEFCFIYHSLGTGDIKVGRTGVSMRFPRPPASRHREAPKLSSEENGQRRDILLSFGIMALTTYEVTLPHTSLEIGYGMHTWKVQCPYTDGKEPVCSNGSEVIGYRYSRANGTDVWFKVHFYEDPNVTLEITINDAHRSVDVTPANGMLVHFDDFFQEYCSGMRGRCFDRSEPNVLDEDDDQDYNMMLVRVKENRAVKEVRFTKAVYQYPTHKSGASVSVKNYPASSIEIEYTGGWSQNGSYIQSRSGSFPGVAADPRTFAFNFDGRAVWVWGFCGPREVSDDAEYGELRINNIVTPYYWEVYANRELWPQDPKCLLWFSGNLKDSGNVMKYSDERHNNFQLHSIDVLQVSGGTDFVYPTTTALPSSTETASTSKGDPLQVDLLILSVAIFISLLYGARQLR
ncbi:hypothetical protein CPB86DRAFT_802122 [Serendipita vermifera]|nr:hypothetical protein CPB86DRAFT_802122 [Serendipita vermifera]